MMSGAARFALSNDCSEIVSESDFEERTAKALKNLLRCGFSSKPGIYSMNLSTETEKTEDGWDNCLKDKADTLRSDSLSGRKHAQQCYADKY
jgi:hypothetical protein